MLLLLAPLAVRFITLVHVLKAHLQDTTQKHLILKECDVEQQLRERLCFGLKRYVPKLAG